MNDETNTELETPVTETPEYPPEPADDDIVLRRLKDEKTGEEMDLRTPWIEREVMVPTTVRIPLYEEGVLLSTEKLAKLNLAVVEYTQEQVDQMTYPAYYRNNPDLAPRVRQYKGYLDSLGLAYNATTDDIEEAVAISTTIAESDKLALVTRIKAAFDNIVLNLQALGLEFANYEAWRTMRKLIKYLPEEDANV